LLSAPRVVDINPAPVLDFIESIASVTYELAQKQGGVLPYSVIREIAENFIHAQFRECTVSVLDKGNTIRFSDQGPGIEKKRLVQQPGITSATAEMKRFIRGVGSGFPIVREYLAYRNGFLSIDDNAKEGSVITLSIQQPPAEPSSYPYPHWEGHDVAFPGTGTGPGTGTTAGGSHRAGAGMGTSAGAPAGTAAATRHPAGKPPEKLDKRSMQVLRLLNKKGILGPSDLMEPLEVSAATAHRILVGLEKKGLIEPTAHRKRILSNAGFALLEGEDARG
jgi:hypothetical protein